MWFCHGGTLRLPRTGGQGLAQAGHYGRASSAVSISTAGSAPRACPDSVGGILTGMLGTAGYSSAIVRRVFAAGGICHPGPDQRRHGLEIMRDTGHRSLATQRRYIREGQPFRAAAAGTMGLLDDRPIVRSHAGLLGVLGIQEEQK